ncbi:MAG: peptidylprolyl isomerase [Lachnospiraceae bacterium]|nr:peptidylprolyl isomerase [Lachnospiraceae bacterium]
MMRRKKTGYLLGVMLLAGVLAGGCADISAGKEPQEQTTVVLTTGFAQDELFRIGKSSCRIAEAMVYLVNMQNQYESVYGSQIWEKDLGEETLQSKLKDIVLARLAQIKTMNLLAEDYGVTLSPQEEQKVSQAAGQYYGSLNQKELELIQADEETIENLYREYALANKVYNTIIEDVNPEISDDEARTITVKTIFIKTYAVNDEGKRVAYTDSSKKKARERAVQIRSMAADGEDFDSLISKYNEGENSTYSFGKGEMEPAFEDAAFNLGTDEISGVVETEYGYYIIKCISTFDRKETDANKEKIVEKRKKEAFNQVYDDFVASLLRNLNTKLWDKVELSFDEEVTTDSFFRIYNEVFPSDQESY